MRLFSIAEFPEQIIELRLVADYSIANENLYTNLTIIMELNLPSFAGNCDFDHNCVPCVVGESVVNMRILEAHQQIEQIANC